MLYGAYGSTGRLILDEALRRGHRPIRSAEDDIPCRAAGRARGRASLHRHPQPCRGHPAIAPRCGAHSDRRSCARNISDVARGTHVEQGRSGSAAVIAGLRSRVWAEAGNAAGQRVAAVLETGEGYRAAAVAAVCALELQLHEPRLGALTPAQAFGADFPLLVPGTRIKEL
jgi:short subunit dehydrogenase-like uncharacterized protein